MSLIKNNTKILPHTTHQNYSYQDIVTYLNTHWKSSNPKTIQVLKSALQEDLLDFKTIIISGTTGKTSTIYFLSQLFQNEGLKVGSYITPHFNLYNERFHINNDPISNTIFTEIGNQILRTIKQYTIPASSRDFLTMMALLFFSKNGIDIALLEHEPNLDWDPIFINKPQIFAITRIVQDTQEKFTDSIKKITSFIQPQINIICADQSKITLQQLSQITQEKNAFWIMPIRKAAPLPYPLEQLYGRCAALAERIADTFFIKNPDVLRKYTLFIPHPQKQRGRPRLNQKKHLNYLNSPIKNFWQTMSINMPYHFNIVQKQKPIILLDNAHTIDSFKNLFLGIRLFHYKNPLKNITFLFGCYQETFDQIIFLKALRYFFKKNSNISFAFCPITIQPEELPLTNLDIEKTSLYIQQTKFKTFSYKNFTNAIESILKELQDAQDMLVITGSREIIEQYLNYKKEKAYNDYHQ